VVIPKPLALESRNGVPKEDYTLAN